MSDDDKYKDKINEILESDQFSPGEKWIVRWQFRLLGDFNKALAETIIRADDNNLHRLSLGFPDEVGGFLEWNRGGLAERLKEAGLDT